VLTQFCADRWSDPVPDLRENCSRRHSASAASQAKVEREATSAIMSQVPMSQGDFRAVFYLERNLSAGELAEIESLQRFSTARGIDVVPTVKSNGGFASYLEKEGAANVIVVGHNDKGNFVFLDGSRTHLWSLTEECEKARKNCIFVSCRSSSVLERGVVGVKRDLTLEEGIYIADRLQAWLKEQKGSVTVEQMAAQMSSIETKAYLKYHVSFIVMKSCLPGAGVVLYIYVAEIRE
jgi:prepilin-type processing-associated H-X9-DG protein